MKMNTEYIRQLIDKFMDGETTLAEEQTLYSYFSAGNVDDGLAEWKDYFSAFGLLQAKDEKLPIRRRLFVRRVAVAVAVVAVGVFAGTAFYHHQNYCEAFIYGEKVTDKTVVMKEMKATLNQIDADNQPSVDQQLRDVLL